MWWFAAIGLRFFGARPLRLTPPADKDLLARLDGLLIGGGDDIGAEIYGGMPVPDVRIDPERDELSVPSDSAGFAPYDVIILGRDVDRILDLDQCGADLRAYVEDFGGTLVLEKSFLFMHNVLLRIPQENVTGCPIVPTILAMLPDTGERYLSTYLCEEINEGSDDDWLETLV